MALIQCSKCGKQISDKAKKCPHCGANNKISNNKKSNKKILFIVIFILLIVLLIGGGIFAYQVLKDNNDTDVKTENSKHQIIKNTVHFFRIPVLVIKRSLIKHYLMVK